MSHELQRHIFKTNETAKKLVIDKLDWLQVRIVTTMTVTVCHKTVRCKVRAKGETKENYSLLCDVS